MALIKCTGCGHSISDRALKCPKCGTPIQKQGEAVNPPAKGQKVEQEKPIVQQQMQEPQKEEVFVSASGKVYSVNGTPQQKQSNVWVVVVVVAMLLVLGGCAAYFLLKDDSKTATVAVANDGSDGQAEEEFDVESFIMGYYDAVVNGGYASYFEDHDITFFNLEHVSKSEVVKAIDSAPKRNTSREYDWATLRTTALPMGAIKAVFSSDYYIHYESRTDKYRITTEMIISPNRKIQSLKDIETVKMGLPFSTFVKETTEGDVVVHSQNKEVVKNLKKLGFELTDSRTEQRLDHMWDEYYDFTIETYSKTVNGRTTTVKFEEYETEIHFPNLDEVKEFAESVRKSGMRETANGFEDPEEIYWVGTIVSIKGTIVVLTYKWEP